MYEITDSVARDFASHFHPIEDFSFEFMGKKYSCTRGIETSLNNQGGYLRQDNFFGSELEFTLYDDCRSYPLAFQLYQNTSKNYRIFLYTKGNKMLTSVNLTTGLEKNNSGRIIFEIQIKITSPQNISPEERKYLRDECIGRLRDYGVRIDKNNRVFLGEYDIPLNSFIHGEPKDFITNMLIVGICRNAKLFDL